LWIIFLCWTVFAGTPARSQDRPEALVLLSSAVVKEIRQAPDWESVRPLFEDCRGMGIFPGLKKAAYIVGGQFGRGILLYRDPETGNWSPPAFYKIRGGSIGFQVGIQETDLILFFYSRKSFEQVINRGFNVGFNLSAAAGPVGREIRRDHKSEVFAYSRSKGLFAGATISGAGLFYDFDWSKSYYGDAYNAAMILLQDEVEQIPDGARDLQNTLYAIQSK
jgi:lipid-binding SYLF domain-containing protein